MIQQIYGWMAGGLTVTGLVALWTASSGFIEYLLGPERALAS